MQTDGIRYLADLVEHLDSGKPLPDESATGISAAIRHALCSGDSLDAALGLHRAGRSNSLTSRLAKVRRNEFIVQAVRAVREGSMSDWQCCKRLAASIESFGSGNEWRKTRYQNAPPSSWPTWKRCLWWAMSTDLDLPKRPRQLYAIVQKTSQFNPHDDPEKLLASKLFPSMQDAIPIPERQY